MVDSTSGGAQALLKKLAWPLAAVCVIALLVPIALQAWSALGRDGARDELVSIHQQRARDALKSGDHPTAEAALQLAVGLDPSSADVQLQTMRLWVERAALYPATVSDDQLARVAHALDVLQQLEPSAPQAPRLVARAHLAARRGEAAQVQDLFAKAIAADPSYVHAHLGLALLHRAARRTTEALASFEKAVEVAPTNVTALNNLGVQYVEFDRRDDALVVFQRALDVRDTAATRLNMADTLARMERGKEAIEHMTKAARLAPSSAEVHKRLGQLLVDDGRLADAEQVLLKSLDLAQDPETAHQLGVVYQSSERYEQAAKLFTAVVKAKPQAVESVFQLARSLHALGKNAEAATAYNRYLSMAEHLPDHGERVAAVKQLLTPAEVRTTPETAPP